MGWDNNVIGISAWTWCYALRPSIAIPHELDATLYDLQLQFHTSVSDSLGWGGVGWGGIITSLAFPHDLDATLYEFIGISTWSWCYALWSSLAFPHEPDATLYDLQLHFHMILMLRFMIFNCNSTHPYPIVWGGVGWGGWDNNVICISAWTWCYALWPSIAIPHELDATLYDLHWHFHMILMLRSMILIGISTWTWCYTLWSSIALPHDLDATLYDLQLQFHMILMLRSMIFTWHFHMILMLRAMIFIGISTWSWCYALWSSRAFPHEPDATLYDLQLQFHMNLMLRSMIFIGISTWSWCYVLWSSLAFPHELDATLYDLQCEKKLRLPFLRLKCWKGCHSQSRRTFFFHRFWMQKLASRCEDVVILIIFARR